MYTHPSKVRLLPPHPLSRVRLRPRAVPERDRASERDVVRGRVRVRDEREHGGHGRLHVDDGAGEEGLVPVGGRAPPVRAGGPPARAADLRDPRREEHALGDVLPRLSAAMDGHVFDDAMPIFRLRIAFGRWADVGRTRRLPRGFRAKGRLV
jgi:hypothetical protein